MSPGITFTFHTWRGIGGDLQADLFMARIRLAFVTVTIESNDWLPRLRKLRATAEEALKKLEGRK